MAITICKNFFLINPLYKLGYQENKNNINENIYQIISNINILTILSRY